MSIIFFSQNSPLYSLNCSSDYQLVSFVRMMSINYTANLYQKLIWTTEILLELLTLASLVDVLCPWSKECPNISCTQIKSIFHCPSCHMQFDLLLNYQTMDARYGKCVSYKTKLPSLNLLWSHIKFIKGTANRV